MRVCTAPAPRAYISPRQSSRSRSSRPGDDTWKKLPFYAARGIQELVIVDPEAGTVDGRALTDDGEYQPLERSRVIELSVAELVARLGLAPPS